MSHGFMYKLPDGLKVYEDWKDFASGSDRPWHFRPPLKGSKEKGSPWLTLVLGSGCASPSCQSPLECQQGHRHCQRPATCDAARIFAVADAIPSLASGRELKTIEGMPVEEVVRSYARSLVRSRVPVQIETVEGEQRRLTGKLWIFDLVTASALLTKVFFRIKAESYDVPQRSDHPDHAVLKDESRWKGILEEQYLEPCRALLKKLELDVAADDFAKAFRPRLRRTETQIGSNNGEVVIRWFDVNALAELAWYSIIRVAEVNAYPGWNDLLLALNVTPEVGSGDAGRNPVGSPRFQDFKKAEEEVSRQPYLAITKQSWQGWQNRKGAPIFQKAARLLSFQSKYIRLHGEGARPPVPTAFIASFDLELELALLSLKQEFTVAIPVYILDKHRESAYLCWIGFDVLEDVPLYSKESDPHNTLLDGALLKPSPERWRILGKTEQSRRPVVVRLAGCPVIELPSLLKAHGLAEGFINNLDYDLGATETNRSDYLGRFCELSHAVMISEHDAVLQTAVDLISISGAGMTHGIPHELASGRDSYWRYWMMLGVQVGDRAVRQRIANLIAALPLTRGQGRDLERINVKRKQGIAVNRDLTDLDQDLLFWNGLDVVRAGISDLVLDLDQYGDHIEKLLPSKREQNEREHREAEEQARKDRLEWERMQQERGASKPRAGGSRRG